MAIQRRFAQPAAATVAAAFDANTWSAQWTQKIADAQAKKIPAAQLAIDTRDMFEALASAGAAAKGNLFFTPLSAALGAEYAQDFVANKLGLTREDVASNLAGAIERTVDKQILGLKSPADFDSSMDLVGANGKVVSKLMFNDITGTRAHVTISPAHTSKFPAMGGDVAGGVEKFWRNRAIATGNKAFIDATHRFEFERGVETLSPGDLAVYDTGIKDVDQGILKKVDIASVPKAALRKSAADLNDPALLAQREAHQLEMTALSFKAALMALAELHQTQNFTAANPGIISKPILCTGPDGSVELAQAAKGDRQVLDPSSPLHQRILKELKAEGIEVPPFEVVTCYYVPYADGAAQKAVMDNYAKAFAGVDVNGANGPQDAKFRFDEMVGPMGKDGGGPKPFTNASLGAKLTDMGTEFAGVLKNLPKQALDVAASDPAYFASYFKGLGVQAVGMAYQMAKLASIPDLLATYGVQATAETPMADRIAALMQSEQFRSLVVAKIDLHPAFADARRGKGLSDTDDAKLTGVMMLAMEDILQQARWKHLETFYKTYETEMAQSSAGVAAELEALRSKLSGFGDLAKRLETLTVDNKNLEEQTEQLVKELTLALDARSAAEAQSSQLAKDLASEIAASAKKPKVNAADMDDLKAQITRLRDQLSDQKDLVKQWKSKAEAQTSYARSSPSISSSSY